MYFSESQLLISGDGGLQHPIKLVNNNYLSGQVEVSLSEGRRNYRTMKAVVIRVNENLGDDSSRIFCNQKRVRTWCNLVCGRTPFKRILSDTKQTKRSTMRT